MARALLLLVATAALLAPRAAADGVEVGEAAPALPEARWIVPPDGITIEALRGLVVLVHVWGENDAARPWPRLDLLQETFWSKGLRVLVLARTDHDALDLAVRQRAFAYPVASVTSLGAYEEAAKEKTTFLVGVDGDLLWHGALDALDGKVLAKALRTCKPRAKAWSDFALEAWARLGERCVAVGAHALAIDVYDLIEKAFEGAPEAEAAREKERALKKDGRAKREIAAAKAFVPLATEWLKVGDSDRRKKALAKRIDRFLEKHEGTRAGDRGAFLLGELRGRAALLAIRAFIAEQGIDTARSGWRTSLPKPPKLSFERTRTWYWMLRTSEGPMRLRLFTDVAPMHVSSTIYLTELGYYDGLTFHRVIPEFMAQGGCPLGSGNGNPGYAYDGEFDPSVGHDRPGLLSMANSGAGTDGSQFFILFEKKPHLDGKHTIFGEVVEGMDTLKKLEAQGSAGGATKKRLVIEKATVEVE